MLQQGLHDPFFVVTTADEFSRELIADLAAGRCAAIRVPEFMTHTECDQVMKALVGAEFESYGRDRVFPEVMRFGVGVSDHRADGAIAPTYWPALAKNRRAWEALGLARDPFEFCRARLAAHWPGEVKVATNAGRELAPGVAREPNHGFIVHYDDSQREFTAGLVDGNTIAQFAFNLYISVPEQGGETIVWRHRWQPSDERHRLSGSYGFDDSVVDGAESFMLRPRVGEALLFEPRNYHAVRPSSGGRRVALGFSLALIDTGEILAWG